MDVLPFTCIFRRDWRYYVLSRNMKNIRFFLSENNQFVEVTFSIYLNRHVFVMTFGKCADLDHPVHAQSISWAFVLYSCIL